MSKMSGGHVLEVQVLTALNKLL